MAENTFKRVNPNDVFPKLQKKAAASKDAALHPAGSKGMDKLKMSVLEGLHTVLSKMRKATKWSNNEGAGIGMVVGGGIVGIGLMSGLSFQEMMMSSTSMVPIWGARAVVAVGALSAAALATNKISSAALVLILNAKRKLSNKLNGSQSPVMPKGRGSR